MFDPTALPHALLQYSCGGLLGLRGTQAQARGGGPAGRFVRRTTVWRRAGAATSPSGGTIKPVD